MSGYGPRRALGPGGGGGAAMAPGAAGRLPRNVAAKEAQKRLQMIMTGQGDDDSDDDDRYQPPIAQPAQTRPGPPPQLAVSTSRRGMAPSPGMGGPLSPESNSGSHSYQSYSSDNRGPPGGGGGGAGNRRYGMEDPSAGREIENLRREVAKLRDDIDVLSEENEFLLDKLRRAEKDLNVAQTQAQELVKQVSTLGGGISMEARLLAKKEAALKQKEAALKAATEQNRDLTQVEINNLRLEAEAAKEEAMAATDMARQAENELRQLRSMTARLVLNPEEKEDVVLKRCWLARYWLLAKHHGVHAEVAGPQADLWQGLAPIPHEVVLAAGQKAKEDHRRIPESETSGAEGDKAGKQRDLKDLNSDINIESMFQVEKGLRDLASLKVEEGVLLAMAQHRRPALVRMGASAGGTGGEGPRLQESADLSEEEIEDVQFKQNWLVYFWRRARTMGVEADLADERLQYWIARTNFQPKAHDAVDADRGLLEIRKLGVEQQLWDTSRGRSAGPEASGTAASPQLTPAPSSTSLAQQDGS